MLEKAMLDFESQLMIYPVLLSALKACCEDVCLNCIGLEAAKTKTEKGLKKLMMDVKNCTVTTEEKKKGLLTKIESLATIAEKIPLAESCSCQKSAEKCFLAGCIPKFLTEQLPNVITTL